MTPEHDSYSFGDLEALSGGQPSLLQFWIKQDVLMSEGASTGRGVHRRFSSVEVELAALMVQMAPYISTVKALKRFAKRFRARATSAKFATKHVRKLIDDARNGDDRVYLSISIGNGQEDEIDIISREGITGESTPFKTSPRTILMFNLAGAWSRIPRS